MSILVCVLFLCARRTLSRAISRGSIVARYRASYGAAHDGNDFILLSRAFLEGRYLFSILCMHL